MNMNTLYRYSNDMRRMQNSNKEMCNKTFPSVIGAEHGLHESQALSAGKNT